MPPDVETYSYFQDRLLQLLWEMETPARVRAALLADAKLEPFRDYIEQMEDRMIEVAAELVHKWGRS